MPHGSPSIPDAAANPTKALPINRWEHRYLGEGRFPETLSALEIEHFFTLDEDELASVRERRGPWNRLALALQIGFLKLTGRTLSAAEREELTRLRRENKQLRLERDILSRATAWFARETGVIPSGSSGS